MLLEDRPPLLPATSTIEGVTRQFAKLGLGEAVARLVAFAAAIYIARTVGASAYGIIGFATAVTLYLSRIADCGIEYFGLGISEVAHEPGRAARLIPALTLARAAVALSLVAILVVAALAVRVPETFIVAIYGLTLVSLAASTRWALLGLERTGAVAAARIAGEIFFAGLIFVSVRTSADLVMVPASQLAGDALAAVLMFIFVRRAISPATLQLDVSVIEPLFRRSWRLVLSALLGLVIYNSDLILLRFFRDSATVGYYAAAYAFISFLLNLGGSYNQSLLPALTRGASRSEGKSLYETALVHAFAFSLPIAAGGWFLAAALTRLTFGGDYAPAVQPLQVLLWSLPLGLMREVATAGLMASKGETAVLRFTSLAAAANLVLNFLFIPSLGLLGAAIATLITEAVRLAAALVLAHRAGFTFTTPKRFAKPFVAVSVMAAFLGFAGFESVVPAVLTGIVVYSVSLALMGGLRLTRGWIPVVDL